MNSEGYNGWTNYETWYINLVLLSELTCEDIGIEVDNYDCDTERGQLDLVYDTSKALEEWTSMVFNEHYELPDLASSMVNVFLGDVNYYEIAKHTCEDFVDPENFKR